jgi:transcription elongation factor SPT5
VQHHHQGEIEDDAPGGPEVYSAVSQQSLVPSVSDPSLWMISCSTGKEQDLVYQIMNKCVAFARQGRPLGICGVIAAQTKGKIYIESFSEPAVVEAIQGVRGLLQYTMRLVPIGDMTTVMTVVPTKKPGTSRRDFMLLVVETIWRSRTLTEKFPTVSC